MVVRVGTPSHNATEPSTGGENQTRRTASRTRPATLRALRARLPGLSAQTSPRIDPFPLKQPPQLRRTRRFRPPTQGSRSGNVVLLPSSLLPTTSIPDRAKTLTASPNHVHDRNVLEIDCGIVIRHLQKISLNSLSVEAILPMTPLALSSAGRWASSEALAFLSKRLCARMST